MFGIRFRGHRADTHSDGEEFVGHPLRKDYPVNHVNLDRTGQLMAPATPSAEPDETLKRTAAPLETRDMLLNVGPAHPAMHGIIRIVATLDGEKIVDTDVEIGYLHRGFEKMAETVDYNGVIPYADWLNYVSPLINNMGYCMAVEKALGLRAGTVPLHPGDHVGDLADHGPPHLRGRQCHGAGSVHGLSLHDQGARIPLGAGRDGDRRAPDRFVLSGGWSEGRSARRFSRAVRGVGRDADGPGGI